MSDFKKCPRCYLDLEVTEKKIEKQIDIWIEGKHKDSLKCPRKGAVILGMTAVIILLPVLFAYIFGENAVSREEKRLRVEKKERDSRYSLKIIEKV